MQMSRFLFLERNWERDKEHLDTYSSMVIDHGAPHSILIFPGEINSTGNLCTLPSCIDIFYFEIFDSLVEFTDKRLPG